MQKVNAGTAYALWCLSFFGICGVQRFYAGKIGTGLLYFFTFGLFGVGQLLDLIFIPSMIDRRNAQLRRQQGRSDDYDPPIARNRDTLAPERFQPIAPIPPMQKLLQIAKEHGGQLSKAQVAMYMDLEPHEVQKLLDTALRAEYADVMNDPATGTVRYYFDV
jgi:TM2 domain-containing membrane protein YozV